MGKRGERASSCEVKRAAAIAFYAGKEFENETDAQKVERLEAQLVFIKAAHEDALRYIAMEEEDVEEEYRKAGKLHTYDEAKEWKKRLARVAKLHPPPRHMVDEINEYTKYLEEGEDDFRIGLCSFIAVKSDFE